VSDRNSEIIELLAELVELTILDEGSSQSFRVRAYENAMHELELVRDDISEMSEKQLVAIDGVGKSTAKKIREYFSNGSIEKLDKLRAKYPPSYRELAKIPGIGPKSLQKLRSELGVEDIDGLRAAVEQQKIRELAGFGAKSEEKIARAIERMGMHGKHVRTPIAVALPIAEQLVGRLEALEECERAQFCGSLRRFRDTVADIDIVAVSSSPEPVMQALIGWDQVKEVLGHGETKSSVVTEAGLQVDLRVVEASEWGAAILYFTGSKAHNIALRQRAIDRGWTLNEYGLTEVDSGDVVAQESEQAIYRALEMDWVPAPMREDTGEVALAADRALPEVPGEDDLAGDLHVHTALSGDGDELAAMIGAAANRGARFIAITDRQGAGWNHGPRADALLAQADELDELRADYPDLTIFHGCELAIGGDGELDLSDQLRDRLDFAIAGVHTRFELDEAAQTARITRALADPMVRILAHPTGRKIGHREPMKLDVDAVIRAAVEAGVAIEINAALDRLDAPAELLRRAGELAATFAVGTDAGAAAELDRLRYGARLAQRGWVVRDRLVNCWETDAIADFLAKR
jgi:DNA polymerase (family 10)